MVICPRCPKQGPNRLKTCAKQGMVLRAERLLRLQCLLSFLSLLPGACEKLKEHAIARAADKRRVSFPDLHNIN